MAILSKKHLLLLFIVAFSFIYRMLLTNWQTFPPGADIGLHNSIIHTIMGSGNANFVWNNYHMGGVASLTFPGYHIFALNTILITGMPDYFVHSLIVSFFSSFIVLCAFLITRTVWGESASWIVAILVSISRFDLEILMWGGYPNVITLLLIPLIFHFYLNKDKFSLFPFLATTGLLSGAIFLTHSLSSVMFVSITIASVAFTFMLSKKIGVNRTRLFVWIIPIFLGIIVVSPFLLEMIPAYLGAGGEPFTGTVAAIRLAMLATRKLPFEIVSGLLICVPLFFVFSKKFKAKFLTVPAVLFSMWLLIPTILTQGFLFGLYMDYHRFLYFIVLPILILITISIDTGAQLLSDRMNIDSSNINANLSSNSKIVNQRIKLNRRFSYMTGKTTYSIVIITFIIVSFLFAPIFLPPYEGDNMSGFYQVTTEPSYEAINWIQKNAPIGSILVSDALYGWWVSGFAQRPTLSAVTPQFLTLASEVEAAEIAKNLLDTNYLIDNGLIQIREDGGYIGRHNPLFLAKWHNNPFPYPFFHFNSDKVRIYFTNNGIGDSVDLLEVPVSSMYMYEGINYSAIAINRQNEFFSLSQKTTIYQGVSFANMTLTIDNIRNDISINGIRFILQTHEPIWIDEDNEPEPLREVRLSNKTMVIVDDNINVYGQLIFTKHTPEVKPIQEGALESIELHYNLEGPIQIEMFVGTFQIKLDAINKLTDTLKSNVNSYSEKHDLAPPLHNFNYQHAIETREISYILCRDSTIIPKFSKDPIFSLIFVNREVTIFRVR